MAIIHIHQVVLELTYPKLVTSELWSTKKYAYKNLIENYLNYENHENAFFEFVVVFGFLIQFECMCELNTKTIHQKRTFSANGLILKFMTSLRSSMGCK